MWGKMWPWLSFCFIATLIVGIGTLAISSTQEYDETRVITPLGGHVQMFRKIGPRLQSGLYQFDYEERSYLIYSDPSGVAIIEHKAVEENK